MQVTIRLAFVILFVVTDVLQQTTTIKIRIPGGSSISRSSSSSSSSISSMGRGSSVGLSSRSEPDIFRSSSSLSGVDNRGHGDFSSSYPNLFRQSSIGSRKGSASPDGLASAPDQKSDPSISGSSSSLSKASSSPDTVTTSSDSSASVPDHKSDSSISGISSSSSKASSPTDVLKGSSDDSLASAPDHKSDSSISESSSSSSKASSPTDVVKGSSDDSLASSPDQTSDSSPSGRTDSSSSRSKEASPENEITQFAIETGLSISVEASLDFSEASAVSAPNYESDSSISESSTDSSIVSSAVILRDYSNGPSSFSNYRSITTPIAVTNIIKSYMAHGMTENILINFSYGRSHSYPWLLTYYDQPYNGPRPVFMGRYSQYNSGNSESFKCYYCNGKGNDSCGSMSSDTNISIEHSMCTPNQYCAVTRKEYPAYDSNKIEFEISVSDSHSLVHQLMIQEACVSYAKEYHSKYDSSESHEEKTLFLQKVKADGCEVKERPNNEIVIKRGCKSISSNTADSSYLSPIQASIKSNASPKSVKIFSNSYCATELCNTGDGRLRCFACKGSGRDDPCMLGKMNDTSVNIVTCEPNEFCHIMRTVTLLNVLENRNVKTEWNITRSCKAYSEVDEDFQVNDGDEIIGGSASLACASDLCNSVDGTLQSQPGKTLSSAAITGSTISINALFFPLQYFLLSNILD